VNLQVVYYYIAMTSQRFLYYTPWCLTDSAMIACGISYDGEDEKTKSPKFYKIVQVHILEVELGTSPATMMIVVLFAHY
jgi:hypothetical protein